MAKQKRSAADFLPEDGSVSLSTLRSAAEHCQGCDLYQNATQVVFGEGATEAPLMILGEAPGDQEDRKGRPFVGPAGTLLNETLENVGIARGRVYITNVVKHFKFAGSQGDHRRVAKKPTLTEMRACRPWLEKEVKLVQPQMLLCLGATAAQTILGQEFRLTQHRGEIFETDWAPWTLATIHPAALLRIREQEKQAGAIEAFQADLAQAARHLKKLS